ncbi:MAG: hypothetical protein IJ433_09265 [Ruminococcus sp.]|nr:hypothetical protein [Ruminococcus sp.]
MKDKNAKASIWQHASVVMLMVYLASTFLMNLGMLIGQCLQSNEEFFENSVFYNLIFEVCYVFRICLTDCAFLSPASTPQLERIRLITVIVTLVVCLVLMYLATLIYKPCAKPVILIFAILLFLDFIASIIFMVYPMWVALSLKAVLIVLLLLALGSLKTTKTY